MKENIDFLHLKYDILMSFRQYLKGSTHLEVALIVQDTKLSPKISKNILKKFSDSWKNFFNSFDIELTQKKNGAYIISKAFTDDVVKKLQEIGFKKWGNDLHWTQYMFSSNNVFEINDTLYGLLTVEPTDKPIDEPT